MAKKTRAVDALARERRFNRRLRALLSEVVARLERHEHDLQVQFRRLAQLQAELDLVRASGVLTSRSTTAELYGRPSARSGLGTNRNGSGPAAA